MSTNAERSAAYEWGFEKGEQVERERIIKELERDSHWFKIGVPCQCGAITPDQIDYVVALIKGRKQYAKNANY